MQTIHCDNCGDKLERYESTIRENNFCNKSCFHDWQGEQRSRVACDWCDEEIVKSPSQLNEHNFCNKQCYGKWKAQYERDPGKHHEYECIQCGETATTFQCWVDKAEGEPRFCSRDCRGTWESLNRSGSNHHQYDPDATPYFGNNWLRQRRKALARDDYCCQACGVNEKDVDKALHVHHIQPRKDFEVVENSNELSNLVTLCSSCHGQWEGLYLRPDTETAG